MRPSGSSPGSDQRSPRDRLPLRDAISGVGGLLLVGEGVCEQLMGLLPDPVGFFFFRSGLREQLARLSLVYLRVLECLLCFHFMRSGLIGGNGRLELVLGGQLRMVGRLALVVPRQLRVVGRFVRALSRLLLVPRGILAMLLRLRHRQCQLLGGRRRGMQRIVV